MAAAFNFTEKVKSRKKVIFILIAIVLLAVVVWFFYPKKQKKVFQPVTQKDVVLKQQADEFAKRRAEAKISFSREDAQKSLDELKALEDNLKKTNAAIKR